MNKAIDNADLIRFYFTQSKIDEQVYFCKNDKCINKRGKKSKGLKQGKNKGYTNLRNHLRSCVGPDFENTYLEFLRKAGGRLDKFAFTSKRDGDVYKIMCWVIMRNQALTEVDDPLTRELFNVEPISSKTLRKYILSVVPIVEDNIREELPNKFCVMLDGWTDNKIHYVAIYCTYTKCGEYCETLIACAPLLNEEDLSADQHFDFLVESLSVYGRSLGDVVCLVGDNCSVNQRLSNLCGIPLIGCYSHKFNLAVEHWIKLQPGLDDALETMRKLMKQLRTLKNSARLRNLTHLGALLPNETRWTGNFDMVQRYFRIEEFVKSIPEMDSFLPSVAMRRKLHSAVSDFKKFKSITMCLQKKGLQLLDVRFTLDEVCHDYPDMNKFLSIDADLVTNKPFETAISKIIAGQEHDMSVSEKTASQQLRLNDCTESLSPSSDENMSYFERIQAKRRRLSESKTSFIDVKFIPATSCSVERLFSMARWILTVLRKRMSPILFEALIFLKCNHRLWDIKSVAAAMKLKPQERYVEYDNDCYYE